MDTMVKRTVSIVLAALALTVICAFVMSENTYAAIKLSKKSIIIGKGQSVKLKVKGTKKKVKWSSTKKSVATVTKKGVVKGKKIGSCYIKAKVAGKTLKCKVAVKKPEVVTAMKLRKYILSKGKEGKWDGKAGYAIGWKYDDQLGRVETARVCAYENTTEMYFEFIMNYDEDRGDVTMNIDLCKGKAGKIRYYYRELHAEDDQYDDVGANIDYAYNGTLETLKNVTIYNTAYGEEGVKNDAVNRFNAAFTGFNKVFKKANLKSTMKKIGFSKWSA